LVLAVGGGMCAPSRVLGAFAIGSGISILAALGLEHLGKLGARGYLAGFTAGQMVALAGMLVTVLRSLPAEAPPLPRGALRRAFRDYRLLAISALSVYAAVWIDKLVTLALRGTEAAATLASVAALAWFSVIPVSAWIYVQVETRFYRAFRGFFQAIERGAPLDDLETRAELIRVEAARLVRGTFAVQAMMLVFTILAAPHVVTALGYSPDAALSLRVGAVASSLQVMTLLGLLLLHYLDLRREACAVALVQLGSVGVTTVVVLALDAPAALGAACGSVVPVAYTLVIVRRAMASLVVHTFQSQP
jgi:uncharacterized membrane protein